MLFVLSSKATQATQNANFYSGYSKFGLGYHVFVLGYNLLRGTASWLGLAHLILEALFVGGLALLEWRWREVLWAN